MSVRSCPHCCHPTPRLLGDSSAGTHVWYFRCEQCGHVFSVPRDNPEAPPWTVVPGKGDPQTA
jgi:hypothetical protein